MKEKIIKIKFTNDFHNTETIAKAKYVVGKGYFTLTENQIKRINRRLCGIKECTCSGDFKQKGEIYINDNLIDIYLSYIYNKNQKLIKIYGHFVYDSGLIVTNWEEVCNFEKQIFKKG